MLFAYQRSVSLHLLSVTSQSIAQGIMRLSHWNSGTLKMMSNLLYIEVFQCDIHDRSWKKKYRITVARYIKIIITIRITFAWWNARVAIKTLNAARYMHSLPFCVRHIPHQRPWNYPNFQLLFLCLQTSDCMQFVQGKYICCNTVKHAGCKCYACKWFWILRDQAIFIDLTSDKLHKTIRK